MIGLKAKKVNGEITSIFAEGRCYSVRVSGMRHDLPLEKSKELPELKTGAQLEVVVLTSPDEPAVSYYITGAKYQNKIYYDEDFTNDSYPKGTELEKAKELLYSD